MFIKNENVEKYRQIRKDAVASGRDPEAAVIENIARECGVELARIYAKFSQSSEPSEQITTEEKPEDTLDDDKSNEGDTDKDEPEDDEAHEGETGEHETTKPSQRTGKADATRKCDAAVGACDEDAKISQRKLYAVLAIVGALVLLGTANMAAATGALTAQTVIYLLACPVLVAGAAMIFDASGKTHAKGGYSELESEAQGKIDAASKLCAFVALLLVAALFGYFMLDSLQLSEIAKWTRGSGLFAMLYAAGALLRCAYKTVKDVEAPKRCEAAKLTAKTLQ